MTPQSYATSLIYRGHTPQSVKLATGCEISARNRRAEFNSASLRSPIGPNYGPAFGPPRYSRTDKIKADISAVAYRNGITTEDIMSRKRPRMFSWPRQEAYFVIREKYGLSFPHIGQIMGRDHSTVLHGVRQHEARNAL